MHDRNGASCPPIRAGKRTRRQLSQRCGVLSQAELWISGTAAFVNAAMLFGTRIAKFRIVEFSGFGQTV